MEAQSGADAFQGTRVRARLSAAAPLLGWLEEEPHGGAGPVGREALRDRQRDRHVAVVAARVHAPLFLGGVRRAGLLLEGQRVHVGAKHQTGSVRSAVGEDAGLRDSGPRSQAELRQTAGDERGGAPLLERELGMPVQVPPRRDEALVFAGREVGEQTFEVRHGRIIGAGL